MWQTRLDAACGVYRVAAGLIGAVVPSFRALSGRLKLTARRHEFNKDPLFWAADLRTEVVQVLFDLNLGFHCTHQRYEPFHSSEAVGMWL